MSALYDNFKREADKKIACLKHIQNKLRCLRHFDEVNDWRRIRTACYEIDEEIKRVNTLVSVMKTVYDDYGMFTQERNDGYLRSFRAGVVYFELFYERAARWDTASFQYSRCLNYEKALQKSCAPSDPSDLHLFTAAAFSDPDAINKVLKAEAEFIKGEREIYPPSGKPDTSLPYPM